MKSEDDREVGGGRGDGRWAMGESAGETAWNQAKKKAAPANRGGL